LKIDRDKERELYQRYLHTSIVLFPYHSGMIKTAGYDKDTEAFYVQVEEGKLTVFFDVKPEVWTDFQQAAVKSRYYHTYIEGLYPSITAPMLPGFLGTVVSE
jgi:hypothetical protein